MAPYISKYHIRSKIQGLHELGMSIKNITKKLRSTLCADEVFFYGFSPGRGGGGGDLV